MAETHASVDTEEIAALSETLSKVDLAENINDMCLLLA